MTRRFFLPTALILCFALIPAAFHTSANSASPLQKADDTPAAGTNGYTTPKCSYCPSAPYSDAARKLKIQGDVLLKAVIGTDGRAHNIAVTRGLGYGLDEKAVETVRDKWQLVPANGPDGKPAAVRLIIQVSFHLY